MKAIAQTTGRSLQHIKADVGKKGDLGIVAETSRGTQRIMFQVGSMNWFPSLIKGGGHSGHFYQIWCIQKLCDLIFELINFDQINIFLLRS